MLDTGREGRAVQPGRRVGPFAWRDADGNRRIAVVVKGYPRLSETFIAQEIPRPRGARIPLEIWSLRRPTDRAVHPMHRRIRANLRYLPEYLYREPLRVLRRFAWSVRQARFKDPPPRFCARPQAGHDREPGPPPWTSHDAGERTSPDVHHLHVHYLHTPASVVRYAALLTGRAWTFSAHAKDIWTTPDWEKREKLAEAAWGRPARPRGPAI
jgi:hypothetical protein